MKAVILLPTYNERENVTSMLNLLTDVVRKIPGYIFTILVIDDNSPDGTALDVALFQKTHPNVLLSSGKKEGLGKALLRGMKYAVENLKTDVIVQIDADESHDPRLLPAFFEKLANGADFVVGSRYIRGGSIPDNWGLHRKIYSVLGNTIVRYALGKPRVHDWTGGYRVFRKKYFDMNKNKVSKYSGYVFQIAFLYNSIVKGATIAEVPIKFTDRRFGRSKIAPLPYIISIYVFIASARIEEMFQGSFIKFMIVGSIGFLINTIILEILVQFGMHPALGTAIGAEFAIVSNFYFNNSWTFRIHKVTGREQKIKFVQFNVASLGGILIQSVSIAIGTHIFGLLSYRVFYLIGISMGLLWNYTMYSRVVWKKSL